MPKPYRILPTPGFKRDMRKLTRRNPPLLAAVEGLMTILKGDPHNRTREHAIAKLTDVPPGEGQWRIRTGAYRLRYDIFDQDVVLYALRHRREAY